MTSDADCLRNDDVIINGGHFAEIKVKVIERRSDWWRGCLQ